MSSIGDVPQTITKPLAWYRFNGDPRDSSGNGHDAIGEGNEVDFSANTARFDAMGDLVVSAPQFALASGFTISLHVRVPSWASEPTMLSKVLDNSASSVANSYQIEFLDRGDPTKRTPCFTTATTAGQFTDCARIEIPPTTWAHVTATWSPLTGKRLYVDGRLLMQQVFDQIDFDGRPLIIGGDRNRGAVFGRFIGELDDVRIYSEVLDDVAVSQLAVDRQ